MSTLLRAACLALAASLIAAAPAPASEWKPHLDVSLMPGTHRMIGRLDVFWPVRSGEDSLWFADLRALVDQHDTFEGNLGLGYRRLSFGDRWILGGYAFFDRRRSPGHNVFHQATLGVEALSRGWDFRANFYLPEAGKQRTHTRDRGAFLRGNFVVRRGVEHSYERALAGIDLEVGHPLVGVPRTRGYLAAYHFRRGGSLDAIGARVRLESRVTEWLTLGSSLQWDDLRGGQGFLEARFRWSPFGRSTDPKERALARRMSDFVVRDVDVVTGDASEIVKLGHRLKDGAGNDQEIWFVKNDAGGGGDGSFGAPFDTLGAAEAAAGPYDVIYVHQGDNTDTNQDSGITLAANQRLVGEGVALQVGGYTLLPAEPNFLNFPQISNAGATAVVLADGNEVAGLTLTGSLTGIRGSGFTDADIHGNFISGVTNGMRLLDVDGTVSIRSNLTLNNANRDIEVNATGDLVLDLSENTLLGTPLPVLLTDEPGLGSWRATFTDNNFSGTFFDVSTTLNDAVGDLVWVFEDNEFNNSNNLGIFNIGALTFDTACIALRDNLGSSDNTANIGGSPGAALYEDYGNAGNVTVGGAWVLQPRGTCQP